MQSIFDPTTVESFVGRIQSLRPDTAPVWGRMNAAQMLAHNSAIFESVRTGNYPKMNPIMRWLVAGMIRPMVIGDRPYRRSSQTAPAWVISDPRDLAKEQARIIENLRAVHALGRDHFEGKPNPTFGVLTSEQWSRLFLKHLDYHLGQFGA